MNSLFYIKNISDTTSEYKNYFKINCPTKQYLDNMSNDIKVIKQLDNSIPCYSQIFNNQPYTIDLNDPSIACTPPYNPSTSYTYRTYKFEISSPGYVSITKPSQSSSNYNLKFY